MKNRLSASGKEIIVQGTATSPGIAAGAVFIFRPNTINISELELQIENTDQEIIFFDNAIQQVIRQLNYSQNKSELRYGDQFSEIFESQIAFLNDPELLKEIKQEISGSGYSAAYSVSKILSQKSDYFINLENTYFRERAFDIIDLKQKLIHALLGIDSNYQLNSPSIVVADMLSPSDTIQFNRNFILGFLTDRGGKTSHAAILARGLKIPSVVNGFNLSQVLQQGDYIIVDGFRGKIIIRPAEKTKKEYKKYQKEYDKFELGLEKYIDMPSVTADGKEIEFLANIGFPHQIAEVEKNKAAGVGLFRTESIFIESNAEPTEEAQYEIYKQLAEKLNPRPLVIRTIDLGGDKLLENYNLESELNPFLGWRAIRFCLDRQDIFAAQLRAILRAGVYGNIKILLPMISAVEEILQTKELIKEQEQILQRDGIPFKENIPLGVMIETPAAAITAHLYVPYVNYFSIGTNDLTQYVLAIDRTNEKVSRLYNTFNPAVLEFIYRTIRTGIENKIDVSVCGEFAALPEAIPILLGMGLRSFSMSSTYMAETKKIISSLDIKSCIKLYEEISQFDQADKIEKRCHDFILKKIPDLKLF